MKKLPTPKQKENGKWLIQVQVDGKRKAKQFDTEDEALYWAAGEKTRQQETRQAPQKMTVRSAIDRYIESKSSILSPSTIRGYRTVQKCQLGDIENIQLANLTQEKIQKWTNYLTKKHAPKTVHNAHGLISAVLKEYHPSIILRTTLPQKERAEIQIPSESEIALIMQAAKETKYELPIALAIGMGLRQSEIAGLTWDCIQGETMTIKKAIVRGENGLEEKGTKTYSGKRTLKIPSFIKRLLAANPQTDKAALIVPLSGKAIYSGFSRICRKAGLPHFRFHDLRHANASIMLAIGVPDKYSMKRMGHKTSNMLKTTYQHTIKEKEEKFDALINAELERILSEK